MNIQQTLADHTAWLADPNTGKRIDLRGAHLPYVNFRDADFRGAYLRNAYLPYVNFRGANLQGADLWDADLRNADLYGANLRSADLRYVDFRGANLQSVDFRGANLQSADLRSADFEGADLRYANLGFVNLRYINFNGVNLRGATVKIAGTDLTINQDMSNFHLILGSKHWGYRVDGYIKIGCEEYTVTEWLADVVKIAKEAGYTEEEQQEYKALIKTASEVF